ncbi:uncharacterized protein LAESUDRAFT_673243 [Laetiporus sulphureus 93-53]|uniref:BIR-domain-containing protein n=1 Tax=Laetiporus sulphureus 93-53 TaxID=1314785 RepID=A0A165GKF0_9APHY|nr:uncharacterized protein LAESUDRAFT_673243 [Laetiporus sulphureus 93-53]KZT10475.1 hypothetical protein LAESUDRAFT_673243 [Laetiporus sulphureus 93-53]
MAQMQCLTDRIDSFNPGGDAHTKKRSKQSSKSFKWPHQESYTVTPQTLAEAGFFFNPTRANPDNVKCFMCKKELDGWSEDDDPFEIHWQKCRNSCPWAAARCGLFHDMCEDGSYNFTELERIPTSSTMEQARLGTFTFKNQWPHDSVERHGANSEMMAKAGFIYTPHKKDDDTATCMYCSLALSSWGDDDDPLEEHVKREDRAQHNRCAFLQAWFAKEGKTFSVSKPASRALRVDSDDELAVSSTSARQSSTRMTRSRASSATVKTPGSRRAARGTSASGRATAVESDTEDTDAGGASDAGKRVSRTKRTAAKKRIQVIEEEDEEEVDVSAQKQTQTQTARVEDKEVVEEVAPLPKERRKRGRPPKAKKPAPVKKEVAREDSDTDNISIKTQARAIDDDDNENRASSHSKSKPASRPLKDLPNKYDNASLDERLPEKAAAYSVKASKPAENSQSEDAEFVAAPKPRPTKVSRAKSKRGVKADSENEDEYTSAVTKTRMSERRADASETTTKRPPAASAASPAPPIALIPFRAPSESSSQRPSGDTRRAVEHEAHTKVDIALPTMPSSERRGTEVLQRVVPRPSRVTSSQHPLETRDVDEDIIMVDAVPEPVRGGQKANNTSSETSSTIPAGSRRRKPAPSRSSSMTRSTGRRAREKMRIVEVLSDAEDVDFVATTSQASTAPSSQVGKAPASQPTVARTPPQHEWPAADGHVTPHPVTLQVEPTKMEVHVVIPARHRSSSSSTSAPAKKVKKSLSKEHVEPEKMHLEVVVPARAENNAFGSSGTDRKASASSPTDDPPVALQKIKMEVMVPSHDRKGGAGYFQATSGSSEPSFADHEVDNPHSPPVVLAKEEVPPAFVPSPPRTPVAASRHLSPPDTRLLTIEPAFAPTSLMAEQPDAPFVPVMAMFPIEKITSLTEEESAMTVEQFIRREMERQYRWLKEDTERQLARIREKAAETRRAIEAL